MAESYYDDTDNDQDPRGEDKEDAPVTEIPRSLAMGKDFKVGDEIVLKIDSIRENSFVVSYAPAKPETPEGEEEPEREGEGEPEMAAAEAEEGGMMGGGEGGGGGMYD